MSNNTTVYICPHCECPYALGVNGTIDGCDDCLKIVRNNLDGTVIDEDPMTDMEKA